MLFVLLAGVFGLLAVVVLFVGCCCWCFVAAIWFGRHVFDRCCWLLRQRFVVVFVVVLSTAKRSCKHSATTTTAAAFLS